MSYRDIHKLKTVKPEFEPIKRSTLTVEECAEYIGISREMVYLLVREHRIPHFRIGRRILFRKDAINKWIYEQIEESVSNE